MLDGRYIGFIDSDDYISEEYVQKLLSKAFERDADIVKCSYYSENSNYSEGQAILYKNCSVTGELKNQILELNGYVWGAVIKRDLFSDFRFPENFWYEDMITRIIIYRKCKRFEFLDDPLYYYVQHTNNISKKVERTSCIKCSDQYFLAIKLYDLSNRIGLKDDETLYKVLQYELGAMLWSRTRELDEKIRKQLFLCACEFMNDFKEECKVNLDKYGKYFEIAFKKHNYILWKTISRLIIWKS